MTDQQMQRSKKMAPQNDSTISYVFESVLSCIVEVKP